MTTRLGRIARVLALAVGAAELAACGPDPSCVNSDAPPAVILKVVDAKTGAAICDAMVLYTIDSKTLALLPYPYVPGCSYRGLYDQPGTFTFNVTEKGYKPAKTTVVAKQGTCHVITQNVTVKLTPR